jgi:hypothetical protein
MISKIQMKKALNTIEKANGYRVYFIVKMMDIGPDFTKEIDEFIWRNAIHFEFILCMKKNPNRLPDVIPDDFMRRVFDRFEKTMKNGIPKSIDDDLFFELRLYQGEVSDAGLESMKKYIDKNDLTVYSDDWSRMRSSLSRKHSSM